jgi:hypothetical protein
MLMIRPWRARSGLSLMTRGRTCGARRADGGGALLPRMRVALVWRRPRRFGHAPSTPPGSKPVALDVRHRIELLMRWTSEIKSFNERVARTVQGWTPRGPEMRPDIAEGRSRRPAALRLLVRGEGAKMGWVSRVSSPARRAIGAAADSGTSLRRAAPSARHLADGGAHWRAPAVAYRRRSLGAAQLFPALKRVIAPQARGAVSLQRHPVFNNGLPLTGREPRARPARLFASATLAPSGTGSESQTSAPVRVARAVRPVELAWRSNSAGSPPAESNAALQRPWSVAARETAAIDVHSRIPVRGETLLSDTWSVNRLAEEVLGRIERKLRVERERRGH